MSADIQNLLLEKKKVQELINNSISVSNQGKILNSWVSPSDRHTKVVKLSGDVCEETKLLKIVREASFDNNVLVLPQYYSDNVHFREDRTFILLESNFKVESDTLPSFPSASEAQAEVDNEKLYLSIHSLSGYDFTAEFDMFYNNNTSTKLTAKAVTELTCCRLLMHIDPSLSDELLNSYVSCMLRLSLWENRIAVLNFNAALKSTFPSLYAASALENKAQLVKIFIGKDEDGKLYFWVRIPLLIQSTFSNKEVRNKDITVAEFESEKSLQRFFKGCYYKRYSFSEILDSLEKEKSDALKSQFLANSSLQMFLSVSAGLSGTVSQLDRLRELYDGLGYDDAEEVSVDRDYELLKPVSTVVPSTPSGSHYQWRNIDNKSRNKGTPKPHNFKNNIKLDSSSTAELLGWGENMYLSLGLSRNLSGQNTVDKSEGDEVEKANIVQEPISIPLPLPLLFEKIFLIACSSLHTLVLTNSGLVYSCGDNTVGALGTGDLVSRSNFTLISALTRVQSFVNRGLNTIEEEVDGEDNEDDNLILGESKIVKISAGSSLLGAHSMALDSNGHLYGWGLSYAVGTGSVKSSLTPVLINNYFPSISGEENAEKEKDDKFVVDVACGACFTVAVMKSGAVASWGMWSFGRLGLGPIPLVNERSGSVKIAKYKLKPAYVRNISGIYKVSCGEAHVLCLDKEGNIYSWGRNNQGQLGTGCSVSGYLMDFYSPVLVPLLQGIRIVDVCCGARHSIATDEDNNIWSWGHCGHPCLGHGDSGIDGVWRSRFATLFSGSGENSTNKGGSSGSKLLVPFELLTWCGEWSQPRKILPFQSDEIVSITAGDDHTAFLTSFGTLYLCGTGPVVPPFITNNLISKSNDDEEDTETSDNINGEKDSLKYSLDRFNIVSTPRCPSAAWLSTVCTRRFVHVASGGNKCFIIQDEELVVPGLTFPLLQLANRKKDLPTDVVSDLSENEDNVSVAHSTSSFGTISSSVLSSRGHVDCMIISSGKISLAHRALLIHRSSVLRNMVLSEIINEGDDDWANGQPTQLLMPELHRDTATALIHYLYTDTLAKECLTNVSLLYALSYAAESLKLARLKVLCDNLLSSLSAAMVAGKKEDEDNSYDEDSRNWEMPPTTLARDLGALVGDPQFSDVRFVVEGKTISAHRFILEQRSEYFRKMFQSNMMEINGAREVIDVVIPGSFVGFLRFLLYLYTSAIPDGSDAALLEDLVTADRFGVTEMALLCENMIFPTKTNWRDVLHTAEVLNRGRLRREVLVYLRDNFDTLVGYDKELMSQITQEFPYLLDELVHMRCVSSPCAPSTRFTERVKAVKISDVSVSKESEIPWFALLMLIGSAYLYQHMANIIVLGPYVTIANSIFMIGLMYYLYRLVIARYSEKK